MSNPNSDILSGSINAERQKELLQNRKNVQLKYRKKRQTPHQRSLKTAQQQIDFQDQLLSQGQKIPLTMQAANQLFRDNRQEGFNPSLKRYVDQALGKKFAQFAFQQYQNGDLAMQTPRRQNLYKELLLADDIAFSSQAPNRRVPRQQQGQFDADYLQDKILEKKYPLGKGNLRARNEGHAELQLTASTNVNAKTFVRGDVGGLGAFSAVHGETISMLINPGYNLVRPPFIVNEKVAIARVACSYPIVVNAAGCAGFEFRPSYLMDSSPTALSINGSWFAIANAAIFAPPSGINGAVWSPFPPPLNGNAVLDKVLVVAAEWSIAGIAATNTNSGQIQCSYFPKRAGPDTTATGSNPIGVDRVVQSPFYQMRSVMGAALSPIRQTTILDPSDLVYISSGVAGSQPAYGEDDVLYGVVSGALANSTPIRVDVVVSYIYVPQIAYNQVLDVNYAQAGSGTQPFYSWLIKSFPTATQLPKAVVNELSSHLVADQTHNYDRLQLVVNRHTAALANENAINAF